MGKGDLGKLQREAGGGGKRAPAPPGYWEPAQGPATPAGLGLGGFCTAGRVCHPPSPGTKPSFYWNFGRQNNQGLLFYRAPRGNPLRGCSRTAQLPGVPTVTTQSHKKRGKLWLWNCSRSRMGCWSRQQLTHCTPGRSSTKSLSHPKTSNELQQMQLCPRAVPAGANISQKNPVSVSREAVWVQKSLNTLFYQKLFNQT